MGARGPVPKRSHEQAGHRSQEEKAEQVRVSGSVEQPPAREEWCTRAEEYYASLAESGQAKYYEPSDWQYAGLVCDLLTEQANRDRGTSAEMMRVLFGAMGQLGTTESDRRRMKIEIEREEGEDEAPELAVLENYRRTYLKDQGDAESP